MASSFDFRFPTPPLSVGSHVLVPAWYRPQHCRCLLRLLPHHNHPGYT